MKYVILSADGTFSHLYRLAQRCQELNIPYNETFPISRERPFTYTLSDYNSTWQGYFQAYLPTRGGLDSDVTAPLLIDTLRKSYKIPEDWTDEEARRVIGLRYELSLRQGNITNLPNFVFIEDVSDAARAAILELNIPGLNVEASTVREYSTKYAAHVLGYVGAMSGDQWAYYKDKGYEMDAMVGQSGFEMAFEEYLHGTDGLRVDEVTKDGTVVKSYYKTEPKSGNNVQVTIDLNLQMRAEDELAAKIEMLRDPEQNTSGDGLDARGGAVVALDAKTGEVLVCASYPTYDLSTLFEKYDEISQQPYGPLLNRALKGTYAPGSTFKIVTTIAGIESGVIGIDSEIKTLGKFTKYKGYQPTCLRWREYGYTHGTIDCRSALMYSCNYFFYDLGDRVGIRRVGSAYMPMDEALAFAAIDISGRPYLAWNAEFTAPMCGTMDTALAEEFFRAVTVNAGLTVHMNLIAGRNNHHKMEALFKAFGLALRDAVRVDANIQGVLSTKGALD